MIENKLDNIIKKLELSSSKENAYMEYTFDEDYEKYLMKVNSDGLKIIC